MFDHAAPVIRVGCRAVVDRGTGKPLSVTSVIGAHTLPLHLSTGIPPDPGAEGVLCNPALAGLEQASSRTPRPLFVGMASVSRSRRLSSDGCPQ